jgi:hypothetical protein
MAKVSVATVFGQLDEAQIKTLKDGIKEMSVVLSRIDDEKVALKDILNSIHDEIKVPKKIINKLAKVYHKKSFAEESTEYNEFESLYTVVVEQ